MKKKIVFLAFALTTALGAQLSAGPPSEDECFLICPCPEDPSFCMVCCRWSVCPQPAC
ncbi:MAG TPA: hypothetical protein VLE27_13500 [Thermoanaerobaculia bacterium]|nr:hypothetical protein [Thermoanaerobaculia bacterium]